MRLRQGRKVGRTLYAQLGDHPTDGDVLVGQVDSVELAEFLCASIAYMCLRTERRDGTPTQAQLDEVLSALVNRPRP
jgi:hypothetical protein